MKTKLRSLPFFFAPLLFTLPFLGFFLFSLFFFRESDLLTVKNIEFKCVNPCTLNPYLKEQMKLAENVALKMKGELIWKIDLTEIKKELLNHPWMSTVEIIRLWPESLQIRFQPKEIKAGLLDNKGFFYPVAQDGALLYPVESYAAPDVVLLRGSEFLKESDLRKKALFLLSELPTKGHLNPASVAEVRYLEKEGFWLTLIKEGIKVRMGDDEFRIKGHRVNQVLSYLANQKVDGRVIDARFQKKVLVKLRKEK